MIERFEDFKLNRQLLNAIEDAQYTKPTPIQQKAIPLIGAGHDVLGIAQTGTGKTAAYLLPLLMTLKFHQPKGPRAVIIAPTKELVIQITGALSSLSSYLDLRFAGLFGGAGTKSQLEALALTPDVIVCTPGRLLDFYQRNVLITKYVKHLVLDEADKMLDMGFAPQIRQILEKLPTKRQNLLFSATFPSKVQKFADEFLLFPERIEVTAESTPAETVEHYYYAVPNMRTKIRLLDVILLDPALARVMVFVGKKDTANNLYKYLSRKLLDEVRVIHANKGQNSRINSFRQFQEGEVRVLVTTDVSARGLDIAEVSHVINFDVPRSYEEYVHRIGRTGRAHHTGIAITFANEAEVLHLAEIEKIIREKIAQRPMPDSVKIEKTEFEEAQAIARDIDHFKRKKNPEFQGAFHDKKKHITERPKDKKASGRKGGKSTRR